MSKKQSVWGCPPELGMIAEKLAKEGMVSTIKNMSASVTTFLIGIKLMIDLG